MPTKCATMFQRSLELELRRMEKLKSFEELCRVKITDSYKEELWMELPRVPEYRYEDVVEELRINSKPNVRDNCQPSSEEVGWDSIQALIKPCQSGEIRSAEILELATPIVFPW